MKNLYFIVFCMIFIFSCKSDKTNKVEIQLLETKNLKLERIIVDAELYRPIKVFLYNQKLIVYDDMNSSLFKVFDSRDLKYNYSFGSIGQGPNEFVFVYEDAMNASDYFEILDRNKLCYYAITDSAAFQVSAPKIIDHKSGPVNNLKKISDSIYIFNNNTYDNSFEKEFILYNINNRTDREFGDLMFFEAGMKNQEIKVQYSSLVKSVTVNAKNNKFATFYYKYPYFKIFSSETLLDLYHINTETQPENDRIYFAGVYSTDKYIYALWLLKSEEEIFEDLENFKPDLLIFDWDGNLIHNYKLDAPITSFAVSNNNDRLYAISFKEEDINAIYACDLDF